MLPERKKLKNTLAQRLKELRCTINEPDTITFAGNGEPTIHPDFGGIIDDTIENIYLSGIVFFDGNYSVLINNKNMKIGDSIGKYSIKKINNDHIILTSSNERYKLSLQGQKIRLTN